MSNDPKDLQIIETSREINHARQVIAADMSRLRQMLADKGIVASTQCWINYDGSVSIYLSAGESKRPFKGYGGRESFFFGRSPVSYDEAYNKCVDAVKDAEGDMSAQCAPWFDMKVYDDEFNAKHFDSNNL